MKTLILDSATKNIRVVMSSAPATTNPDFTAAYADNDGTTFTEGANDGALNGTTVVTAIAAPTSGRRIVKQLTIHNRDTQANTITISYNNNGTLRTIARVLLQAGDTWTMDGTFDNTGNYRQIIGTGLPTQTGQTGKVLTTDGATATWQAPQVTTGKAIAMAIVFGG